MGWELNSPAGHPSFSPWGWWSVSHCKALGPVPYLPQKHSTPPPPPRPTLLLSRPQSQSGANQSSNLDSYLNAQSLLGHPAAVGFSAVQRGKGILNPQLLTCLLKDVIVGLTEVFEHLFPLVNAHQQIALVGFVL